MRRLIPVVLVGIVVAPTPAYAQAQNAGTGARIAPAYAGDCLVTIELDNPRTGSVVGLVLNLGVGQEQKVTSADMRRIDFPTGEPLQIGYELRSTVNGQVAEATTVQTPPPDRSPVGICDAEEDASIGEQNFVAAAYFANLIDTFAPDSIGDYQNPDAGGRKTRQTFGVFFDGRLAGSGDDGVQFWVYAETLYGVRSADIDCSSADPDSRPGVCSKDLGAKAKYILEHATSLEAFINPRLELVTLQKESESPIRLYVTGRLGFIALTQSPTVFKTYQIGGGVLLGGGPFQGSYIDLGWGGNELFSDSKWDRMMVDGTLVFSLQRLLRTEAVGWYIQMRVDNDIRGNGADAIQTLYGLTVDVGNVFGFGF